MLKLGEWFAILPKFGGVVSFIACVLVVCDILSRHKHHLPLIPAITLAKTTCCIVFSFFGPFMSTWMAPRGDAFYALGTTRSCDAQGFLVTFSIVGFVSYFVSLVVVYGLKGTGREANQKTIRRVALLAPLIVAMASAIAPLLNEAYNFSGIYSCSIAPYPLGCGSQSSVQCARGSQAHKLVGCITLSFNAMAFCFAFFGYYKGDGGTANPMYKACPSVMTNCTWCIAFLIGYFLILRYGSIEAKIYSFFLNVTITPLTGLFMSLIYFHTPRKVERLLLDAEDDVCVALSEPLVKRAIEHIDGDEETTFA